ncbi:glycosyl hydrolase [Mucilaginibacter sp. Mucisp86]|uniref:glycosyl hydrolase n=1 Tax=Mucilaginibacter sp. Mucisp86 TaxID=3243060 RepID=UPI0039B37408
MTFNIRNLAAKVCISVALSVPVSANAQSSKVPVSSLYKGFVHPDNAAKPRVWWHWINGNITKDGIRKDLLWMKRSGIGGFQNFDAGVVTPQVVAKRLLYMTPEWKDAFRLATKLADSLKLEMAIAGSPGWSESGGPWVAAKDGMKKLIWSEVRLKGGQPFTGTLPRPPATTGDFQNLAIPKETSVIRLKTAAPPEYYEDVAVVAYRLPAADISLTDLAPKITSNAGSFTLKQLTDGNLETTNLLPSDPAKGYSWIQYEFAQAQTIKAVSVTGGGSRSPFGLPGPSEERSLEVSDDGINFRRVAFIPHSVISQQTITIPPTTARYFRLRFNNPEAHPNLIATMLGGGVTSKPPAGNDIAELVLYPATRINHFEEKAGFVASADLLKYPTPNTPDVIAQADVVDLTWKMDATGSLNWTPPATGGEWKIVRFGYSLTGKQNHPASVEATGLEVDKMDARAVKEYFTTYLNQYKDATGGLMGSKGLQYMITDSYEAGQETWTPGMMEEFQKRRGYSLLPWMPVLTGQVIKSAEASEQFLWDWRKTISELITENHYNQLTGILTDYGMKRYSESHENGRLFIVDGMDVKRTAAIPMSAMWTPGLGGSPPNMAQADILESASVAHIYGQNLVAAESFTAIGFGINGAWSYSPEKLKPTADLELASGVNRFVIHTSVHQPVDDKIPGLGLSVFGQWFNRHDTWANQAKVWTDYLARSSYMLQQGKFVADIVYYYGEDNNITGLFGNKLPDVPTGYSYDFINPHALINLLYTQGGKLVTPSGIKYKMLVIDSIARKMSLPVLRKIAQLVKEGAVITGIKPEMAASLNDDPLEFQRLVNEVWNSDRKNVFTGKTIAEVLSSLSIRPDFEYSKPYDDTQLRYVHRKVAGGDIYWVNNRNDRNEVVDATFRVIGKTPQIWHPETGKTEPVSYKIENNHTNVSLNFTPNDALFIVFLSPAKKSMVILPAKTDQDIITVKGPWNVTFQPDRGAPLQASFENLVSYTEHTDPGIKYFSGTATYTKSINIPVNTLVKGAQIRLDLGDVKNLAEVVVNGKLLGTVWKKPFSVNVNSALKPGENRLEIKVTNLWVNRLIGDQQPDVKQKVTYTTMPFYNANSKLLSSGLLGPVKLVWVKIKK